MRGENIEELWYGFCLIKAVVTGVHSVRETPDHVDVLGKTRSGAVFTAGISGGVAPESARFTFKIRGSEG